MPDAICLRCAAEKPRPWTTCGGCGFDPRIDDVSLIKSVYLSVERFDDADRRKTYQLELTALAESIRRGDRIAFDEADLPRLRRQKDLVESVPSSAVWSAVVRLFLPAVVVLLVLVAC